MKPNPLLELNHFTVPIGMECSLWMKSPRAGVCGASNWSWEKPESRTPEGMPRTDPGGIRCRQYGGGRERQQRGRGDASWARFPADGGGGGHKNAEEPPPPRVPRT